MASKSGSTTVRGIDYASTFRFTEIFRAFRIATQPGKLALGLMYVVVIFVASLVLDGLMGGASVRPGEFELYTQADGGEQFDAKLEDKAERSRSQLESLMMRRLSIKRSEAEKKLEGDRPWSAARDGINTYWNERVGQYKKAQQDKGAKPDPDVVETLEKARRDDLARVKALTPTGIFSQVLEIKINAFARLVTAVSEKNIGWEQFNPANKLEGAAFTTPDRQKPTVIGSLRTVVYELPAWLWHAHKTFMIIWMIVFLAVWALFGGALSRMAVVEAATDERESAVGAFGFARRRWLQYVLAPVIPPIIVSLFALGLAAVGLLFHVPALDVIASVLFALAVPIGFVMAFFLVLWVGGVHLMYPAISAEGTDAFDALSRSYSYVLNRPWRFVFYSLVALVYGTVTYLFVGLFVFLALYLVQGATSLWTGTFDKIMPEPRLGHLGYDAAYDELSATGKLAAVIVRVWVYLAIGLVAAYAVSFYFSAYGTIYLLLRRRCDGVSTGEVYTETASAPAPAPGDKLEPGEGQADAVEPSPLSEADAE